MILPYTHDDENDKLVDLAKLYSLKMEIENGQAIFYKTKWVSLQLPAKIKETPLCSPVV